jgi:hypothetical protein
MNHPRLTGAVLRKLWDESTNEEKEDIARDLLVSPDCPSDLVQRIYDSSPERNAITYWTLTHPNCPPSIPESIVDADLAKPEPDMTTLWVIAESTVTSRPALEKLMASEAFRSHRDFPVRMLRNPSCPISLLRASASSTDMFGRIAPLGHPNCPQEILEDCDDTELDYALHNPNAPVSLFDRILDTQFTPAWRLLVDAPNAPPHLLQQAATFAIQQIDKGEDDNSASKLVGHPKMPEASRVELARAIIRADRTREPNLLRFQETVVMPLFPGEVVEELLAKEPANEFANTASFLKRFRSAADHLHRLPVTPLADIADRTILVLRTDDDTSDLKYWFTYPTTASEDSVSSSSPTVVAVIQFALQAASGSWLGLRPIAERAEIVLFSLDASECHGVWKAEPKFGESHQVNVLGRAPDMKFDVENAAKALSNYNEKAWASPPKNTN